MKAKDLNSKFEELGKQGVRDNLTHKRYGPKKRQAAEAWLDKKHQEESEELERSNKAISDESLALAREANHRSKISNRIKIARIIAMIVVAAIGWWLLK